MISFSKSTNPLKPGTFRGKLEKERGAAMKLKRLLPLLLALLLLLTAACGGNETAVSETEQVERSSAQTPAVAEEELPELTLLDEPEEPENGKLPVYGEYYYDLVNVVLYLDTYDELPPNYITKSEARALGWEGGSVEDYLAGAAIGGDSFGNREGLLPKAAGRSYTECDIDTDGYGSRGARRLVFSNDGLYFYTSDHYEHFSEVTVTEEYEVIW